MQELQQLGQRAAAIDYILAVAVSLLLYTSLVAAGSTNLPSKDLEFITGHLYSAPEGRVRSLALYLDKRGLASPAPPDTSQAILCLGSDLLVLVDSAFGHSQDSRVVWYGMANIYPFPSSGASQVREHFDAKIVWARAENRLFILTMDAELFLIHYKVFEVALDSEPLKFALQLSLNNKVPCPQGVRPLTSYRMEVPDNCFHNQLQVIVESSTFRRSWGGEIDPRASKVEEESSLVMRAGRNDGSCPERWAKLDLKSLAWSKLQGRPVVGVDSAGGKNECRPLPAVRSVTW